MDSRITPKFYNEIREWIAIEEKLKEQNKIASELRKRKNTLEEALLQYIKENKLSNVALKFGTKSVIPYKGSQLPPLNMEFIQSVLNDLLGSRETVEKIISSISRKREASRRDTFSLKYKNSRSNKRNKLPAGYKKT